MAAKLGRAVTSSEQKLPSMKRTVSAGEYGKLRCGLSATRDIRDDCLDQLEDLKQTPGEDMIDEVVEKSTKVFTQLQECLDTLQEAFKPAQPPPPPIKKDQEAEAHAETAMDGGWVELTTTQLHEEHPKERKSRSCLTLLCPKLDFESWALAPNVTFSHCQEMAQQWMLTHEREASPRCTKKVKKGC